MITIAFDRCEAIAGGATCGARPEAICTGCGTARCSEHGLGDLGDRHCTTCAATILTLATAPFDDVLDTRLRLVPVVRF